MFYFPIHPLHDFSVISADKDVNTVLGGVTNASQMIAIRIIMLIILRSLKNAYICVAEGIIKMEITFKVIYFSYKMNLWLKFRWNGIYHEL